MKELWKPCYYGRYSVSNTGRVRNDIRRRVLTPDTFSGYAQVHLFFCGVGLRQKVHILVAEAFLGPRPEGHEVNHKDANKLNNAATNLEYVTKLANARHAVEHGRYTRGVHQWKARATDAIVREIRRRYKRGNGAALGREFGLDRATVNHIIKRRTWTHV